ncbi:hypothetical protein NDU88_003895 [Pleurodeles waltl]|uniref:Death domain-containing protein n=1 Tax=Pleurodeles waltl TaxID=8319 RepID=A0AAV7LGI5_PLEWA|nr:hypothetical protein NDU88_003895 [Pleurodeles waltl]
MVAHRALWERTAAELFDGTSSCVEAKTHHGARKRTTASIIKELEKARISELKKWWEMTSLTKYIKNGRVPRGLRILILLTLGDMDMDLLEEWRTQKSECSTKLMGTLIIQAKLRMDEQIIEGLMKELEKVSNQDGVQLLLSKMEEQITKQEEEIKTR